jgi:hypothetical protein
MSVIHDTQSGQFAASPGADVQIEIQFASGQKASWTAKLDGKADPWVGNEGTKLFVIGKGADIKGKVLQITAFMTDVNPATNLLAHKVVVRAAGSKDLTLEYQENPQTSGESALYTSLLLFA